MEENEKIEKIANKCETYREFITSLKEEGLGWVRIIVIAWMALDGIKADDKLHEDWKKGWKLKK